MAITSSCCGLLVVEGSGGELTCLFSSPSPSPSSSSSVMVDERGPGSKGDEGRSCVSVSLFMESVEEDEPSVFLEVLSSALEGEGKS